MDRSFLSLLMLTAIIISSTAAMGNSVIGSSSISTSQADLLEMKLSRLESVVQEQAQLIGQLQAKIERLEESRESRRPSFADAANDKRINNSVLSSGGGMPTSCQELNQIGHSLTGFYSVKGTNGIQHVYCDFTKTPRDTGFQTLIGYSKIVSSPVYFNVQKRTATISGGVNKVITFDNARLNVGGAMNINTGIFTAPRAGVYFFLFSGIKDDTNQLMSIDLQVNGARIALAWADGRNAPMSLAATIHSTLTLNSGDQVRLTIGSGGLYDDGFNYYTSYSGWLLEENVFAAAPAAANE